jgi:hypothetical protein
VVPITRDYIAYAEARLRALETAWRAPLRLAGEQVVGPPVKRQTFAAAAINFLAGDKEENRKRPFPAVGLRA